MDQHMPFMQRVDAETGVRRTPPTVRLMAVLDQLDQSTVRAAARSTRFAADDTELTIVLAPGDQPSLPRSAQRELGIRDLLCLEGSTPDAAVSELVAHIRRLRPEVVLADGCNGALLARAAVAHAADPHFGHVCTSRGP